MENPMSDTLRMFLWSCTSDLSLKGWVQRGRFGVPGAASEHSQLGRGCLSRGEEVLSCPLTVTGVCGELKHQDTT